jgi:spore germination protein
MEINDMNNKISTYEYLLLCISAILGVGILTLPRRAAEFAGIDGIFAIAIAGVIVSCVSYIYAKLVSKFEKHTIFEFSEFLIGKHLTRVAALLFSIHLVVAI